MYVPLNLFCNETAVKISILQMVYNRTRFNWFYRCSVESYVSFESVDTMLLAENTSSANSHLVMGRFLRRFDGADPKAKTDTKGVGSCF